MYIISFSNWLEVLCKCYMAQRSEVPHPWSSQSEPSCCVCNMVRLVVECCCSLSTWSTCRNPWPTCTHLHHTVMPLIYTKVCASNVHNCHHQHSFLFHYSTYPCNSNLRAHCIPTKLFYNTWYYILIRVWIYLSCVWLSPLPFFSLQLCPSYPTI